MVIRIRDGSQAVPIQSKCIYGLIFTNGFNKCDRIRAQLWPGKCSADLTLAWQVALQRALLHPTLTKNVKICLSASLSVQYQGICGLAKQ